MKYPKRVWITRDTCMVNAEVYDVSGWVKKVEGCILYVGTKYIDELSPALCRKHFSGYPRKEECWLVEEKKDYFLWTRYDHLYEIGEVIEI